VILKAGTKMNLRTSEDRYKMNDDWLIGFVEGEGSFSVMQTPAGHRPLFSLGQKGKEIIFEIRNYLNFGHISYNGVVWVYAVTRYEDIRKLIYYFDGRLLMKPKQTQFERWKECFNEWAKIRPKREWEKEDDEVGKKMVEEDYSIAEIAKGLIEVSGQFIAGKRKNGDWSINFNVERVIYLL
jgi:hypothetical protein